MCISILILWVVQDNKEKGEHHTVLIWPWMDALHNAGSCHTTDSLICNRTDGYSCFSNNLKLQLNNTGILNINRQLPYIYTIFFFINSSELIQDHFLLVLLEEISVVSILWIYPTFPSLALKQTSQRLTWSVNLCLLRIHLWTVANQPVTVYISDEEYSRTQ